jgi:hypothetical protein
MRFKLKIDISAGRRSRPNPSLEVASPLGIPNEITLNILSRHERQHRRIVWRKEKRIGVVFAE